MAYNLFHMFSRCSLSKSKISRLLIGIEPTFSVQLFGRDAFIMDAEATKEDLVEKLKILLADKSWGEAMKLSESGEWKETAKNCSSDLITLLAKYANEDDEQSEFCQVLLEKVSEESSPEEALLELIEEAEDCNNNKLIIMLKPMRKCLLRMKENWAYPVEWSINTVLRHLSKMRVPEDCGLEGDQRILLDNDSALRDITDVYRAVLEFYSTIIEENERRGHRLDITVCKDYTVKSLIKLLGKPLVFTDLQSGKTESDQRIIARTIIAYISKHKVDPIKYLEGAMSNEEGRAEEEEDESCTVLESEFEKTSLGVYFYLIFSEEIERNMPEVYEPVFILERCIGLCGALVGFSDSSAQLKGLRLAEAVVKRVDNRKLDHDAIDFASYCRFMEALTGVMSYSDDKENRRSAVRVFRLLLYKLDSKGRYLILLNIQDVASQPGFVGYLATLVKDILAGVLSDGGPDREFFTGKRLHDLLATLCSLHRGAESDLVDLSDSVISSLNLLRFLVIRDSANLTGIWDLIPKLQTEFLDPLKQGVRLSQAHYRLKKEEVASGDPDVLSIAGTRLPHMPKAQKLHVLDSALNLFDLIDSLLSRVKECIQLNVK